MIRLDYDTNSTSTQVSDLICMANVKLSGNVESKVKLVNSETEIVINGEYTGSANEFCVMADEIVLVTAFSYNSSNDESTLTISRSQLNTKLSEEVLVGKKIRNVVILDERNGITTTEYDYEDSIGTLTNNIFPVEVSSGKITIKDDLRYWTPYSSYKRYRVRVKKTVAYIFKGVGSERVLRHSTLVTKVGFNSKGKSDPNRIKFTIKNRLTKYYEKDLSINQQIKDTTPKDMFQILFGLEEGEVYYANGVNKDSFVLIGNIHTKEYSKINEILQAYCSCGVRFCFDRFERIKIFSDMVVENIVSQKDLKFNLTDTSLDDDIQLVYNTVNTTLYQRQTLYDFEQLDEKYVLFSRKLPNAVHSSELIARESLDGGGYSYATKTVEISDVNVSGYSSIGDYVVFKFVNAPYHEFYGRILNIVSDLTTIALFRYDKDYKLLEYGKYEYLYNLLVNVGSSMDLYYVKNELPIISKFNKTFTDSSSGTEASTETKDSNLMYPILPKVDGEAQFVEKYLKFGCASNLKVGSYTGYNEEVEKIYGLWSPNELLYNMEIAQFSNTSYPPIFALSNHLEETSDGRKRNFTSFDNRDLFIEITKPDPSKNDSDAKLRIWNDYSINSSIDLVEDEELSRINDRILEVSDISIYKLNDVIVAKPLENPTDLERNEYDEIIKTIRWQIIAKESQLQDDGVTYKHYIFLDSSYPRPSTAGENYKWDRYPNTSIVYLQEMYIRGNPVIEVQQTIDGIASDENDEGETSNDIYDEQQYSLEAKLTNKNGIRLLLGYILDNFSAINFETAKFVLPIKVFNEIGIELLDVITIQDTVYTQITSTYKWLVVSAKVRSKSNELELKLLNLNLKTASPYDIPIDDILDYTPVDIPEYNPGGGEGDPNPPDDGTGGSKTDKKLGQFWLAEIPSEDLTAIVDRVDNGYIYFKDFAGNEKETYPPKLFSGATEFGVEIDGEVIFVQSDSYYRARIKARQIYDTELAILAPEMDVKFYSVTTFVDVNGDFRARKVNIGDGDTYFIFHPLTGAKFVGDFVVGDNNRSPSNDLWDAIQKNKTFRQNDVPTNTEEYTIKNGDMWYDTDDDNRLYVYENTVWIDTRDQGIVKGIGSSRVYFQASEPQGTDEFPLKDGDVWYDTDDGNHPYVYQSNAWVDAQDKVFETVGGNKVYFQDEAPTIDEDSKRGDMWIDTNDNNKMYILIEDLSGVLYWELADDANDKIEKGRVVLNANTTINGDFVVKGGNVEITGNTKITGVVDIYSGGGFRVYDGVDENSSNKRIVLTGGEILFQEKV